MWTIVILVAVVLLVSHRVRGGPGGSWGRYRERRPSPHPADEMRIEQMEARIAELENRLDFTERLLTERSAPGIEGR